MYDRTLQSPSFLTALYTHWLGVSHTSRENSDFRYPVSWSKLNPGPSDPNLSVKYKYLAALSRFFFVWEGGGPFSKERSKINPQLPPPCLSCRIYQHKKCEPELYYDSHCTILIKFSIYPDLMSQSNGKFTWKPAFISVRISKDEGGALLRVYPNEKFFNTSRR